MTNNNIDWIFPILRKPTRLWNIGSTVTVSAVGLLNKFLVSCLNTRQVFNKEHLYQALERPAHIPLITVSNHHSCLDDPGIWGATLRGWKHLCDRNIMRWSLAAHDICFTNRLHSYFFMLGKCVPVIRGAGVDQDAIHFCQEKLALGHWVHIFPEGGVNMTHEPKRFKWGVGKLVWDCDVLPIVIPLWHVGMETILPNVEPYTPQIGKKVTINIGKPIQLGDLVSTLRRSQADPVTARKSITDVIQHEVMSLKPITEKLHSGWTCS